jgi:hypothetical protein
MKPFSQLTGSRESVGLADPQVAALVGGRLGLGGHMRGRGDADAEGERPLHEAAAADPALAQLPLECLQVIHSGPPVLNLICLGIWRPS